MGEHGYALSLASGGQGLHTSIHYVTDGYPYHEHYYCGFDYYNESLMYSHIHCYSVAVVLAAINDMIKF